MLKAPCCCFSLTSLYLVGKTLIFFMKKTITNVLNILQTNDTTVLITLNLAVAVPSIYHCFCQMFLAYNCCQGLTGTFNKLNGNIILHVHCQFFLLFFWNVPLKSTWPHQSFWKQQSNYTLVKPLPLNIFWVTTTNEWFDFESCIQFLENLALCAENTNA